MTVDNITWLDFVNPTPADIAAIKKIHDFHPLILLELTKPSAHPKAERYDHYIFFNIHIPNFNRTIRASDKAEIDFLITEDHIITVHYQELDVVREFAAELKKNADLRRLAQEHTGKFSYYFLQKIQHFCLRQLAHMEKDVQRINQRLFTNEEHIMLQEISFTKRNILNYLLIIKPQETSLQSLKEVGLVFWGEGMRIYCNDLIATHNKISHQVASYRDIIESFETTNSQLLNLKTNAIMQRFTILAFLTFPLAVFTGLYNVPEVGAALDTLFGGFWYSFAVMIVMTIATLLVFMNKKWF